MQQIRIFILKVLAYFLPKPASAPEGTPRITRKGIRKIIIMLISSLILGALTVILLDLFKNTGHLGEVMVIEGIKDSIDSSYSITELGILYFCAVFYFIMPFLRYIRKWLKVTGMIYAFACGYILFFFGRTMALGITVVLGIGFLLTAAFGIVPYLLFKYRNIRLPKKLSQFTYVAFVVMTLGSGVLRLLNQIPFIAIVSGKINDFSGFTGVRFLTGGMKVVIASLFIFLAFDRTRDYLRRGVSREYEWLASFTIFYTVSIILLKILELMAIFSLI